MTTNAAHHSSQPLRARRPHAVLRWRLPRNRKEPVNLADAPDYLTVKQLAEVLQVPAGTIYRWRHEGDGPRAVRLSGRHVRFRRADVEAFVDGRAETETERRRA